MNYKKLLNPNGGRRKAAPFFTATGNKEISMTNVINLFKAQPKPDQADYGHIVIVDGPFQGKFGTYDDDEVDDEGTFCAVVYIYPESPGGEEYFLLPHSVLRRIELK